MRALPALLALLAWAGSAAAAPPASVHADVEGFTCQGACVQSLATWEQGASPLPGDDEVRILPGVSALDAGADAGALSVQATLAPAGSQVTWQLDRAPLARVAWTMPASSDAALGQAACAFSCAQLAGAAEEVRDLAPDVSVMAPALRALPEVQGLPLVLGSAPAGAPGALPADAPAGAAATPGAYPAAQAAPRPRAAPVGGDEALLPGSPAAEAAGPPAPALRDRSSVMGALARAPAAAVASTLAASLVLGGVAARVLARRALDSPTRRRILDAVRQDPGCTVGGVARATGLSYKTAQHHARVLVRARLLGVAPGPQVRLFAAGSVPPPARQALLAQRPASARSVLALLALGPARQGDLAGLAGLAPSTVCEQVRRLEGAGLVRRLGDGRLELAAPRAEAGRGPPAAPSPAPPEAALHAPRAPAA